VGPDARHIERSAARIAAEITRTGRGAVPPRGGRRLLRRLALLGQAVTRKAKTLVREHWDVGLFDVLFGSLKAFAIYPALYFAGLAWAIPVMETLALNTQLWTAGYLAARGQLLSELGRRRYGYSLNQLDALRDRLLGVVPRDARHVHVFRLGGARRVLRIRSSRIRTWLARWRGGRPEAGVAHPSQLRRLLRDPEFLFRANPLRANSYLYEAVLLARLLTTPQAHAGLLALSAPAEPQTGEGRALRAALGESHVLALARVTEQADALAAALRGRFDATALRLHRSHALHRRAIRRRLRELADLEYRLLAEIAEGGCVAASSHTASLQSKRAELRAEIDRGEKLTLSAKPLRGGPEARVTARPAAALAGRAMTLPGGAA
jgi:hypothetical protein